MLERIAPYWKAVIGFVAPGAGSLLWALNPNTDGGSTITGSEWLGALLLAIVTSGAVAAKANRPRATEPAES